MYNASNALLIPNGCRNQLAERTFVGVVSHDATQIDHLKTPLDLREAMQSRIA